MKIGAILDLLALKDRRLVEDFFGGEEDYVHRMRNQLETLSPPSQLAALSIAAEVHDGIRLHRAVERHIPSVRPDLLPRVIVTGLPRTGTTWLQSYISALPTMSTYLGYHFCAERFEPPALTGDMTACRKAVTGRYRALEELNPNLARMHPLGPDLPEECTPLLRCGGPYLPWWFMCPGNGTLNISDQSYESTYKFWSAFYSAVTPSARRGVAKSPLHVAALADLLAAAGGDALIVVVRRHPEEHLRSLLTMVVETRRITCDDVSPESLHRIAAEWLDFLKETALRARRPLRRFSQSVFTLDLPQVISHGLPEDLAGRLIGDGGTDIRSGTLQPPATEERMPLEVFGLTPRDADELLTYDEFFCPERT